MAGGDNDNDSDSDSDSSEGSSLKGSSAHSSPPRRSRASSRRPPFKRNPTPRSRFSPMLQEELAHQQREFHRRAMQLQPTVPLPLLQQSAAIASAALGPGDPGLLLPVLIEQRLALQQVEIQRLLHDNQQLAASHLSLRQELSVAQEQFLERREDAQMETRKDEQIKLLLDRVSKQEVDLRAMQSLKDDLEKLMLQRQELSARLQQETMRAQTDTLQLASFKAHVEGLQKELEHARVALEQERKASAEHLLHRQAMERSYHSVLEEVGRLRIELAEMNAHKAYAGANSSPVQGSLPQHPVFDGNNMQQDANKYPYDTGKNFTSASANGQQMPAGQAEEVPNDPLRASGGGNEWSVHVAPNGKYFFHNNMTGMTHWDKSTAMVAQEQTHMQPLQEERPPNFGQFSRSQPAAPRPTQTPWHAQNGGNGMNAPYAQALEPPGQMSHPRLSGQAITYPGHIPPQIAVQSLMQHGYGQLSHAPSLDQAVMYPGQMPHQIANQSPLQHGHGQMSHAGLPGQVVASSGQMPFQITTQSPLEHGHGQMSNTMLPGQAVMYGAGQMPPQNATQSPLPHGQGPLSVSTTSSSQPS